MKNKKDLPLVLIQKLAPFVGQETDLYKVELKNNTHLMEVYDLDDNSDFHFFVKEYRNSANYKSGILLLIEAKPYRSNKTEAVDQWIEPDSIDTHFSNWLNLLKQYNDTPSFYDDPILKAREEEFFTEFADVIPEEEKEKPFEIPEILQLDKIFDQLAIELTKQIKEANTESVANELNNIKEEISVLHENIHIIAKRKVIQKMASFYARLAKLGLPYIKKFGEEFKKEAFKKIISFGLSKASEIIDLI